MREKRSGRQEFRVEQRDGKSYLSGYVATFGATATIGEGKRSFRERVMPGCFTRALREKQDVRHTQNHDPSRVLGRTAAGTTVLTEDATGLRFETLLPDTSYARDLAVLVERGDVSEGSFGFEARSNGARWVKDADGTETRELVDVDVFDVATVTYPAYEGTSVGLSFRSAFPDGLPPELQAWLDARAAAEGTPDARVKEARSRAAAMASIEAVRREVRAMVQSNVCELQIYGDIGENFWSDSGGITAKSVRAALDAAGGCARVLVTINSAGGDAFEGIAIHNVLRGQGKPVDVRVDGLAASAAAIVAMAGDTITLATGAMIMIHGASDCVCGTAADFRRAADYLDAVSTAIAQVFVDRTKMTLDEVKALMDTETWMGAEDCLAKGFCTDVAAPRPGEEDEEEEDEEMQEILRSSRALRGYRNVPAGLLRGPVDPPSSGDDGLAERMRLLRLAEVS